MPLSNRDLWAEIDTEPSASLADDVLETLDRMHHRAVTRLQIEHRSRAATCLGTFQALVDESLETQYRSPYEARQATAKAIQEKIDADRRRLHETIASMESDLACMKKEAALRLQHAELQRQAGEGTTDQQP